MNVARALVSLVVLIALGCSGCRSLDVAPASNPARVITGTVNVGGTLPAGTEVVVRLLASPLPEGPRMPASDLPVATRPVVAPTERLLGEFTTRLGGGTNQPVPFTIHFEADDALLRRGLNLDARVSVAGRVRYRTINAHAVTLNSARFPQEISVQAVAR